MRVSHTTPVDLNNNAGSAFGVAVISLTGLPLQGASASGNGGSKTVLDGETKLFFF